MVHKNTQLTKLELNTEQDIVMLNALMISNSSMERPTQRIGMMIKAIMDLVVQSLMFGRLINTLMLTQPILAKFQATTDVKEVNVVMAVKDKMESVTKTDVI